eukprot:TRINITY_DN10854_c0_g1_i1.p1 TRINITY_DN10854_c0_g1~~TRINITY_DN10854_c0_g1_i1.p1  ORF type:complete len:147 (-),score=38.15 TRINITY_DN10854_c0_g1_i1:19-417(-)
MATQGGASKLSQRKGSTTPSAAQQSSSAKSGAKGKKGLQSIITSANTGLPGEKASFGAMVRLPENQVVLRKLVVTTVMMFVFPLVVFFAIFEHAPALLDVAESQAQTMAIIGAVVAANLVIVGYVISAFQGE